MFIRNHDPSQKAKTTLSTSIASSAFTPSTCPTKAESSRTKLGRIHWRVPTVLISSFVIGIIGATAHHVFYTAMHQQIVKLDSEQRLVMSSGNALAFLVKVSLAVSTATAFTQCLWFSLRTDSVVLRRMDSMFGVLGNPMEFWHLRFWLRHPVLALTALTTWLLPLSAIFTPSTMTVGPRIHKSSEAVQVLQRDSNYPLLDIQAADNGSWLYPGDSPTISDLGNLNLVTADTLKVPLSAGGRNISYAANFAGPAFQCVEANDTIASFVLPAVDDYLNRTGSPIYWASWIPDQSFGSGMNGSFFVNLNDLASEPSPPGFTFPTSGPPKVYHVKFFTTNVTTLPSGERNATGGYRVIECTLYNATYDMHFALHSDGSQIITRNRTLLNGLPLTHVLPNTFSEDQANQLFNDVAFAEMYALYIADGITTFSVNNTNVGGVAAFLANSPTLGRAIQPVDPTFMDFDQFTFGLEQFFENVTFSWRFGQLDGAIATPIFPFSSSPTRIATVQQSVNAFNYNPRVLFISYGTAIGLTSLCLICGFCAIYSNGATYTNNFSTILRTTRDKAFDDSIEDEDCSGADPLPEHIGDVMVEYVDWLRRDAHATTNSGLGLKVVVGRV